MITHTFSRGWNNGGTAISKSVEVQSGAEINLDETIAEATTDQLIAFVLDVSQIKGLYIISDRALLIQTNDGAAPANTITLAANVPFMWVNGDAAIRDTAGAVITTDVTELYVTNTDPDNAATLRIRTLYDPTV